MRAATLAIAAFSATAAAADHGTANIVNSCDADVYITKSDNGGKSELQSHLSKGKSFSVEYEEGTHEFKISPEEDSSETSAPQTGFVYNLVDDTIMYDVYSYFDFPYKSLIVEADTESAGQDGQCEPIVWKDGKPAAGSQFTPCTSDSSITLTLCGAKSDE